MLRAARLYALLDSPDAFTSSYAHESAWGELEWQRVLNAATWIVAREAQNVIGLAKSVSEPGLPATRYVESAWVAPTHRRRGVLRALLHSACRDQSPNGVTELMLWVLEDNHDAHRAYQALGFESTGDRQYLPAFGQFERRLRREISGHKISKPTDSPWIDCRTPNSARVQVFSCRKSIASRVLPTLLTPTGKRLPILEIVLPGIDEAHAVVRCNHVIKLILGRRQAKRARRRSGRGPHFFLLRR